MTGLDKPLWMWSAQEIKQECAKHSENGTIYDCDNCPVCRGRGVCIVGESPHLWRLDSSIADKGTAPAPSPVSAKPGICEVLGVEVGERFYFREDLIWVTEQGLLRGETGYLDAAIICDMINYPDRIIRHSRLTENEVALFKMTGAKWASRDTAVVKSDRVFFWSHKPEMEDGVYGVNGPCVAYVNAGLMPSLRPGDCICGEWL